MPFFERRLIGVGDVEFVLDLADQLFQNVLHSNHAGSGPELVYDDRQVALVVFEFFQHFGRHLGLGDHQDVVHDLADPHGRNAGGDGLGKTEARPAHQILGIKDSDDVFSTTLRVKDWNAGMLLLHHARQSLVEREVAGQREMSGRGTITSRTVMLSISSAW